MDEQFYCLHLDDYSAAAFTSFGKAYYGTMADIKAFIGTLGDDPGRSENYAKLIGAFREYEAGNTEVKHNVAYQEIPLLEPVNLLGKAMLRLDNYRWEHLCITSWQWRRSGSSEKRCRERYDGFPAGQRCGFYRVLQ